MVVPSFYIWGLNAEDFIDYVRNKSRKELYNMVTIDAYLQLHKQHASYVCSDNAVELGLISEKESSAFQYFLDYEIRIGDGSYNNVNEKSRENMLTSDILDKGLHITNEDLKFLVKLFNEYKTRGSFSDIFREYMKTC